MTSHTGMPLVAKKPATTEEKAATDPGDRSIKPAMISRVSAMATRPVKEAEVKILDRFCVEK